MDRDAPTPRALAAYFARLGLTGFGGPLAHVAMIEEGVVRRRGWLTPVEFADGLALSQMLPGPVSTQIGIYVGWVRAGLAGAVLSGIAFILPAYLILLALSALYWRYGALPAVASLFYGLNPAVIGLIVAAAWRMARSGGGGGRAALLAAAAFAARVALRLDEVLVLLAAGALGALLPPPDSEGPGAGAPGPVAPASEARGGRRAPGALLSTAPAGPAAAVVSAGVTGAAAAVTAGAALLPLAAFCFKVGAFLFGGGYVIVPLMESYVVDERAWMTRPQFLDGIALGQVTPGPILITAAFVGYRAAGIAGSAVATAAIFLPSFLWILACAPQLPRLRRWRRARGFLAAVNPAVVGTIAASAWSLGRASIADAPTAVIAAAALWLSARGRADAALLLAASAAAGLLLKLL